MLSTFFSQFALRSVARQLIWTWVALLFGASASHALTLDEALRLSQQRSQLLLAQEATASAARSMSRAATQLPDPTLKAGVSNVPIDGSDQFSLGTDSMTQRSIGFAQEFTRQDKRRARAARFEREAEAAEAGRSLVLSNLRRDTALAWLDRYYQERLREILLNQRDEARLQIDAAEGAYRGGRGSQADVFGARSAVELMEDRIAQSERQIAAATAQLARWVGKPASEPLGELPRLDKINLSARDIEVGLVHHPQIAVMSKQEAIAQAEAQIAHANKQADWSVELMLSQRGPAYSNMVSVNVSIPLQWDQKNRQERELAAKLSNVEALRAEREEATRAHVTEVQLMLQEWQSDRERMDRYDQSLIPLARERARAAIAAYRGGNFALGAVLEARRNEIDMRVERLRLEMESARLWAQLNFLSPGDHESARQ